MKIIITTAFIFTMNLITAQINLQNGLVASYYFSGNTLDETILSNDGLNYGASLTTDRFGNNNSAYYFDGTSSYIDCGNIMDISSSSAVTFSAWFKNSSIVPNQIEWSGINIGKKTTGIIQLRVNNTLPFKYQALLSDGGEVDAMGVESSSMVLNDWVHVVGIYKDNNVRLFINAVEILNPISVGGGVFLNDLLPSSDFLIGKTFASLDIPRYFNGSIDDIKVYDREISLCEVEALYLEDSPNVVNSLSNGLIAEYDFSGNANDNSGNGFNGIVNGASLTYDRFGNANSAYHFNGLNNYIDCGNIIDVSSQTAISFSAWFKTDSIITDQTGWTGINIGKKTEGIIQLRVTNTMPFSYQAGLSDAFESDANFNESNSQVLHTWTHVVGIFMDNQVRLFVDDIEITNTILVGSFVLLSDILSTANFLVGKTFTDSNIPKFYSGDIDDIRIYNRELTVCEVHELYIEDTNSVVGLLSNTIDVDVTISPNPTNDIVKVIIPNLVSGATIDIVSSNGELLVSKKVSQISTSIDMSSFADGVYFFQVKNNNLASIKKVIKL